MNMTNKFIKSLQTWNWFHKEPISIEIEPPHIYKEHAPLPSIVLIHGAHQSNVTFEYLRHALPAFRYINIEWSTVNGFENNLAEMKLALKDAGPVYFIGHSMGSIYAAYLSQHTDCIGGASVAAPWGGSKQADWVRYMMPSYPLYKEVGTKSPIILEAQRLLLPGRWTNYVSTEGNVPGMGEQNDCVLTVSSMTARPEMHTKYIKATHYEIVMSTDLIHSVGKNFLRASEKYQIMVDK
jgi:pimeloyl-ACP methyl ester carboxylesterase